MRKVTLAVITVVAAAGAASIYAASNPSGDRLIPAVAQLRSNKSETS
jgi:hypothetical protein